MNIIELISWCTCTCSCSSIEKNLVSGLYQMCISNFGRYFQLAFQKVCDNNLSHHWDPHHLTIPMSPWSCYSHVLSFSLIHSFWLQSFSSCQFWHYSWWLQHLLGWSCPTWWYLSLMGFLSPLDHSHPSTPSHGLNSIFMLKISMVVPKDLSSSEMAMFPASWINSIL